MTTRELSLQLQAKLDDLRRKNLPFERAVLSSVAQVSTRAFTNKQNNRGESFQYNSTTPIYVNDDQSPRKLSGKGKTGKNTFNNGKAHTSTYFDSYKDFRASVGADTDAVDWQLTNELRSDYGNSNKTTPVSQLKPARQMNVNEFITGLSRDVNVKKYEGLSKRYGAFLELSDKELQDFYTTNEKELAEYLSK